MDNVSAPPKRKQNKSVVYLCALSIITCVVLAGIVFWTGQRVSDVAQNIKVKNQNLLYEQERLRVLRAEWSHLNSPQRLDRLMQKREQQLDNKPPHSKGTYSAPVNSTIINNMPNINTNTGDIGGANE